MIAKKMSCFSFLSTNEVLSSNSLKSQPENETFLWIRERDSYFLENDRRGDDERLLLLLGRLLERGYQQ